MRIRKNASKVLGVIHPSTSYPPSRQIWDSPSACSLHVCQLNRSPWDVDDDDHEFPLLSIDLSHNPVLQEEIAEGIGHEGEVGKSEEDQINTSIAETNGAGSVYSTVEESQETEKKVINNVENDDKKLRRSQRNRKMRKKFEGINSVTAKQASEVSRICKKTDGKNWRCNRLINNHNSFCDYHFDLMRSRNTTSSSISGTTKKIVVQENEIINKKKKKQKKETTKKNPEEAVAEAGTGNDSKIFYYYTGFGPNSTKRRRTNSSGEVVVKQVKHVDEEEEKDESENDTFTGPRKRVKARSLRSLL